MFLKYNYFDEQIEFLSSDDALFHFTRKETAIEHILDKCSLRLGGFSMTNDPQEYKPKQTAATGWRWEARHSSQIDELTGLIDELLWKDIKFISFCQNEFIDKNLVSHSILKSRMWSQYGDNHSGICIVISKSKLLAQLQEQYGETHIINARNVSYDEPNLKSKIHGLDVATPELDNTSNHNIALNHIKVHLQPLLFNKQPDYKDENEFRVVLTLMRPQVKTDFIFVDLIKCINSIVLGDAFPEVYKPTMLDLAKRLGVPCQKLSWESDTYLLFDWTNMYDPVPSTI
ncbi:DUF2971 domain-containing protein [Shewanella olleyana]|uniref:DUF2971 domain-containing protein n=1 Tax=Shewanella olleyana TaxID=135626 RepID=UPI00200DAA07|nr:DUF2971 domain-containing protein [Shewanella olleyana]MCL1066146.1 DUF2971 domain-containing protein [Shewanella olleyana]